jgi:hypothetical protein
MGQPGDLSCSTAHVLPVRRSRFCIEHMSADMCCPAGQKRRWWSAGAESAVGAASQYHADKQLQ